MKFVKQILLLLGAIFTINLNFMCVKKAVKDYPIKPVTFENVNLEDEFWSPRMEINRKVTIPFAFKMCEETGRIDNFAKAGGLMEGTFCGDYPFDDTDAYKIIEGASYSSSIYPDPKLEKYLDDLIAKITAAQEEDGYLYTGRTIDPEHPVRWAGKERWSNLIMSHELYNAGHLYEAAVAHYQATGKRTLLNIAIKNADLVASVFGPDKKRIPPGHQIIEKGLVKLYRVTGEEKYLNLAKFFLDERGHAHGRELYTYADNPGYCQDNKPIIKQDEAVGHAVRATYMYSGVADVAALTGDVDYIKAIDRIWDNVVSKKLYLTGGIGARHHGEAFGDNYELPNLTAYNETCAAIGNIMWNHRLFLLHGEAKYIDVLERVLYNGFISGVCLSGDKFFYPNPLESDGKYGFNQGKAERKEWFGCACCPSNITRVMSSVPGYIYAHNKDILYVNLFIGGNVAIEMDKNTVMIRQETRYPWDGNIKLTIEPERLSEFAIYIRIPGWARNQPVPSDLYKYLATNKEKVTLKVNGNYIDLNMEKGYAHIRRKWQKGDIIELNLPMPVRRVLACERVKDDLGKVALERGPIVYCAEWPDNGGKVLDIVLRDDMPLKVEYRGDMLGGIAVITGEVIHLDSTRTTKNGMTKSFMAIPYYSWAHRGVGEMSVWLKHDQ